MKKILFVLLTLPFLGKAQIINTVAGTGTPGFSGDGGTATAADMGFAYDVTVDSVGNIYIVDQNNYRIRKVSTAGIITTIAGTGSWAFNGDGIPATTANISPFNIAVDKSGNIYIADAGNHRIRKINTGGIISTIAGTGTAGYSGDGGSALTANLNSPECVLLDGKGNIYISDVQNHVIRKINAAGIITTVAGTGVLGYGGDGGPATAAQLFNPIGITFDKHGNLFIADHANQRIRKVDTTGKITTIAGTGTAGYAGDNGIATSAELNYPCDVAVDVRGNIYIADRTNNSIRKVNKAGILTTYAGVLGVAGFFGDGGPANLAHVYYSCGIDVTRTGDLIIADSYNYRVRKIIDSANYDPFFFNGNTYDLKVCKGMPRNIDTVLKVTDFSSGKTDTWSVASLPAHGTLATSYTATSSGGYITPASLTYTPATGYTGSDAFKVRVTNGTASDTILVNAVISVCPNSIDNVDDSQFSIYPNPSETELKITSPQIIDRLSIRDITGKTVYQHAHDHNEVVIDISGLPAGIFLVIINGDKVRKFVKI